MRSSLSFLLKYNHKKRWFLLGYSALLLECVTPIIALMLQRDLIDTVSIDRQYQAFSKLLLLYAIFFFGPKLWFTVRKVTFFHIGYHLQMSLTEAFLKKIYELPAAIVNKEHAGKLLNHIRSDIADASDVAVNQLLSEAVYVILTIALLSVTIASISLTMLLVVVFVAVVYYFLLHQFGEKTKQNAQAVRAEKANVSIAIEESISAIREIVAYNRQDWQMDHFENKFQNYFQAVLSDGFYKIKILFASEPFLYGTKLIVIFFGGLGAISNEMSLGAFVVSFTLVDQLVTAIGQLFQQGLTGKRLVAAVTSIQSVMGHEGTEFGNQVMAEAMDSIQFKNVTFSYTSDSEPVLNDLTIDFPIGKKIALVGESGCGKSTIAQLLLRVYTPEKGEITINDVPVNEYGKNYFNKISVVFQQPHFIPATIKENLVFDKDYAQSEVEQACEAMLCHEFIQGFPDQYATEVGERGTSLSGGQRQRLALSRAMLKNTDLLILDEATSALDTETEFQVQQNIDKLRKGKTTLVIAHRISTIINSDVIYVLDKGKVVAQGTHETLLSESPIYQELYSSKKVG